MKHPFKINIEQATLDDLKFRLINTRWTKDIDNEDWKSGTNYKYLKELCDYWYKGYEWRKSEEYLNSFQNFQSVIDDHVIHFIFEKGKGEHSVPLLLTHGFPDSFTRFLKIIPLLTASDKDGFSFDVIVPSIPGFGFSSQPTQPGMHWHKVADLFTRLMVEELGFDKFFAHGGDWGSSITEAIAIDHPEHLEGFHLLDVPYYHIFTIPPDQLTKPEKDYIQRGKEWSQKEGAYALIQSTKPQTLGYGLNDSPAGLAAWIVDKFNAWSDCGGNIENCFTKDELLTNITIYWVTQTINSAMRIYYEAAIAAMEFQKQPPPGKSTVPAGVAIFPKDLVPSPKEFAERVLNLQQWTQMPKGGHFAPMEQPEMVAGDIRSFVKKISMGTYHEALSLEQDHIR